MMKRITDNQILGELGETAIKKLVLEMHFIYETRGRLARIMREGRRV